MDKGKGQVEKRAKTEERITDKQNWVRQGG